jgi:hypothetical protein
VTIFPATSWRLLRLLRRLVTGNEPASTRASQNGISLLSSAPAEAFFIPADEALDRTVWAAYAWPEAPSETDDETILRRLLALNLERAGEESAPTTLA